MYVRASQPLFPRVPNLLLEVVLILVVGSPRDPRGRTCALGARRAACISEGRACSTGWAHFGVSLNLVFKALRADSKNKPLQNTVESPSLRTFITYRNHKHLKNLFNP